MKKFNLFDGLNINPIPLEFSNSLTTTEFLLAIQAKVNDLLEYLTTIEKNLNDNVEELEQEVNEYTDTKITEVNESIEEINATIEQQKVETQNTITQQITTLKEELNVKLEEISDFLNLISNGEKVDMTQLINNINMLYSQVDDLKTNIAYVRYKGFNLFEVDANSLQARIESWTYSIESIDKMLSDVHGLINKSKTECNELINKSTQALLQKDEIIDERVTAVLKEVNVVHQDVNEKIDKVYATLSNELTEIRENLNSEVNNLTRTIDDTKRELYNAIDALANGDVVVRPM